MTPLRRHAAVGLLVLLAVAARCLDFSLVFPGDGRVWLDPFDGLYRVRRALFTLDRFPALLRFDPYLGFPAGSPVPAPPLYDWLLGAAAHALGNGVATLEVVAAWTAPLLAGLSVLPIAAAGRCVGSPGLGLAAATIFALLPVAVNFARLGDADHHAAVSLLGALWLAQTLAVARDGPGRRQGWRWAWLTLTRVALVLTWSGSLLSVAIADGVLLALGLGCGGPLLAAQAASLAASALVLVPFAAAERAGGAPLLSATTFSWLHVLALAGLAACAGALAAGERLRPTGGARERIVRAAALGALALGALLAVPALRAALAPAVAFLGREDRWGAANVEQRPLFPWLARGPVARGRPATALYGSFAYLIPLVPLAALAAARDPRRRRPALALAGWTAAFGGLALSQVRFGSDYAASGAIGFALLLDTARAALARRLPATRAGERLAAAAAGAAGAALLWPALAAYEFPALRRAISYARVPALASAVVARSGNGSLRRFAETVRAVARDPVAERDPFARPSFGILAPPDLGYALFYYGRRATPACNAGPYVDPALYEAALALTAGDSEASAVAIARRLAARFVLTQDHEALAPPSIGFRLQREAGSAVGELPHLAHFRLVAEGPPDGRPLATRFRGRPPRDAPPYRLFEVVAGARIDAPGEPGAVVEAELALASPLGRTLAWRALARVGPDGWAHLRVPHPTHAGTPVHALGPYRIRSAGRELRAQVSEAEVRAGAVVVAEPISMHEAGPRPGR